MRESGKMRGGSLRGDSELEADVRVEVRASLNGRPNTRESEHYLKMDSKVILIPL